MITLHHVWIVQKLGVWLSKKEFYHTSDKWKSDQDQMLNWRCVIKRKYSVFNQVLFYFKRWIAVVLM